MWKEISIKKLLTLKLIGVFLLINFPGFNILHSRLAFLLSPSSWYSLLSFLPDLFYDLFNLFLDLILTVPFWVQIGLLLNFQFIYPQLEWDFYLASLSSLRCTLNNFSQCLNFLWFFFQKQRVMKNVYSGPVIILHHNMHIITHLHTPLVTELFVLFVLPPTLTHEIIWLLSSLRVMYSLSFP